MLGLLRAHPRLVGELVEELGLSQPRTSKHLRVLREAGLVRVEVDGPRRRYEIDPAPLAELDAWLAPYRSLWQDDAPIIGH
jgi:DNA-binding transcriptional ArsR family regulator